MTTIARLPAAALMLMGGLAWSSEVQPGDQSTSRFEVRLAENDPAKGLVEATIDGTARKIYLHQGAALTAKDVASAQLSTKEGAAPRIDVLLTEDAAKRFASVTEMHQGKPLAIIWDGKVLAAPIVRDKIAAGKVVITGNFTMEQATKIANAIAGRKAP